MSGRTRKKSRHNEGRKPVYKEHGEGLKKDAFLNDGLRTFSDLPHKHRGERSLTASRFTGDSWLNTGTWWSADDQHQLQQLCASNVSVEVSANALGRTPKSIANRARDSSITLPSDWAALVRFYKPRPREPKIILCYPYVKKARIEHVDLLRANDLVPKSLPDWMRADICQEIMLALYEGKITLSELEANKTNLKWFIRKYYKDYRPHEEIQLGNRFGDDRDDQAYDERASAINNAASYLDVHHVYPAKTPAAQFDAIYGFEIAATTAQEWGRGNYIERDAVRDEIESGDSSIEARPLAKENFNHAINRAKERYGIVLTYDDLKRITAFCRTSPPKWKHFGGDIHRLKYKGKSLIVVINSVSGRVQTVLPPNDFERFRGFENRPGWNGLMYDRHASS